MENINYTNKMFNFTSRTHFLVYYLNTVFFLVSKKSKFQDDLFALRWPTSFWLIIKTLHYKSDAGGENITTTLRMIVLRLKT